MMADHEFCDSCPGCRPAIVNMYTGKALPANNPVMVAINEYWTKETTYAQRRAYMEVTLKNSRRRSDLILCEQVMQVIQKIIQNT